MADKEPSKMPDLKEIGAMASKLFKDVKHSICEIIDDYKAKRPEEPKKANEPEATKPDSEVKGSEENKENK